MATIDESNFRECAQQAIEKYKNSGMVLDALVWSRIIGLYEAALTKPSIALAMDEQTAARLQASLVAALEGPFPSDLRGTCP
ncbi:MAG: hypothetical protein KGL39_35860, partial [Patescibacteria group bacterium]|nr:hypothetical protein [Patescibacteria group bacterium]